MYYNNFKHEFLELNIPPFEEFNMISDVGVGDCCNVVCVFLTICLTQELVTVSDEFPVFTLAFWFNFSSYLSSFVAIFCLSFYLSSSSKQANGFKCRG